MSFTACINFAIFHHRMADEGKAVALDPGVLASVLKKLDDVMAEAARLRAEVSRQIAEQRGDQQQKITPSSAGPKSASRKR